jgi:sialate O-acetylesterase
MNTKANMLKSLRALTAAMLLLPLTLNADELRFSRYFGDGMVLQSDKPVAVSGFADKGATVTVTFAGQTKSAKAGDNGAWTVTLDPMPVDTGPQQLTANSSIGNLKSAIGNVLVGDVFLFARQTTVDIALGRDAAGRKTATAHKTNPLHRAISIKTVPATQPQSDLSEESTSGWTTVDKTSALKMSAAAYYFGRDLAKDRRVPVGVIDLNMGAFFPVGWLSREAQMETGKFYGKTDVEGNVERMENLAEIRSKGEPLPHKEVISSDPKQYALYPSAGYNAVIHPLKGIALKGLIVQLGGNYSYMIYADLEEKGTDRDRPELNRAYVETYNIRKLGFRMDSVTTPRIPKDWRKAFSDETLPMAMVVPPSSALGTLAVHGREMRELLRLTAQDDPELDLILPGYRNVPFSAQPRDEALLAERSLKWALGAVYGTEGAAPSGPLFERLETDLNKAAVHFKAGTANGLAADKGALDVFEAAGVEGEYSPAKAHIDGEVIRLESDTINRIVHVRYNWREMPDQGLVNSAGLPAVPFRTEEAEYHWYILNSEVDLPVEYSTPANEWAKSDVTLINGQLKTHGYPNFTGWLGPVGIKTGPFGPNMGVRRVLPGSPADGKVFEEDVIYSANGNMLGDEAWVAMAAAITESETEAAKGKLVLGIRRGARNVDVEVTLDVVGTYSSTAPYDCPKTEKIVSELEEWLAVRGGGAGFLNTESLFLLGTGNPKVQGLVRRVIYDKIAKNDPSKPIDPTKAGKSWHNSADALLLGEYYHATGDRNVLPHLKNSCDRLAATQNEFGGWRHNFPGGATYGLIPNAGLPGVMGMHMARAAGLDINMAAFKRGVDHFRINRAETGTMIYGSGLCQRENPPEITHAALVNGTMDTANGGISAAGILMGLEGYKRAAHLCSFLSTYAFNNTFGGHGGNFWNNFWTPLGAHAHGREAFIHFMKNHRWYREMNRMYDGSLINNEADRIGGGHGLALVVPRRRLRITGAPPSPFSVDAPEALKPALVAHANKDYAGCEKRVNELLAGGEIGKEDLPRVENLARAARDIQESIASDMNRMEALIEEGKVHEASLDIPQLKGVVPEGDARLAAIETAIKAKGGEALKEDRSRYETRRKSLRSVTAQQPAAAEEEREWQCLVTEIPVGKDKSLGKVPAEEASKWRMKVIESALQAPDGWMEQRFEDSEWKETNLPISWRMYHTALLRTTFNVEDKDAFDGLRIRGWFFRQQGIEVHLNGELIAKVNNLKKKTGNVEALLRDSAARHLRNGENTLAVTSRHNWRWGMLFMKVYNDGFGFRLDARVKE